MADVQPLRGIRYPFETLSNDAITRKVAPPYDVIDPQHRDELYERDPHNIIRIILNRGPVTGDDETTVSRYNRARRYMMDWLGSGVLEHDSRPAVYPHKQTYPAPDGETYQRNGFLARVGLEPFENDVILPHERTHKGPKEDRLRLLKACECNMSPIFALYDDPDMEVESLFEETRRRDPAMDITTNRDGIDHQMWMLRDRQVHRQLERIFEDKQLLIADGHHRYETSLAYRRFRRQTAADPEQVSADAPFNYVLTFLVNVHAQGLHIFPTHRVIDGTSEWTPRGLGDAIAQMNHFECDRLSPELVDQPGRLQAKLESEGQSGTCFVFVLDRTPMLVRFTADSAADCFENDLADSVRQLDVTVLHHVLLERLIGPDQHSSDSKPRYDYIRKTQKALDRHGRSGNMVALMNAPSIGQVMDVAKAGERMPQKSTYFYPKVLSGLVMSPV